MKFLFTLFKKGKIYDPYYQKRTDALSDIGAKEREGDKNKLDKVFGILRRNDDK